ncbi:GNAT family N-acetyltransferase [Solidesulfovibrio alcoholivorans]|uniref:GNAT family N-acetyltransferase n=1 Tax=Solidesulfovibrio alcoholivorans TaxID=81406 RepID=UPI000497E032|nr:GNAT family N-acetyltransferase [Solidesulfovibrio alcoholivorans]
MVRLLDPCARDAIMAILGPAFASHPMFPAGTSQGKVDALLGLFLDTFFVPDHSYLFGIDKDDRLACVALVTDPRHEPKGLASGIFFCRVLPILGPFALVAFARAFSGRPVYDQPYLELFLIGTAPGAQRQGLGKEMLRFLAGFSGEQGFRGLILGVARNSPAYGFYAREGFVVDKELSYRGMPICCMRREN